MQGQCITERECKPWGRGAVAGTAHTGAPGPLLRPFGANQIRRRPAVRRRTAPLREPLLLFDKNFMQLTSSVKKANITFLLEEGGIRRMTEGVIRLPQKK